MLPIRAAFLCGYPLLHPYFLPTKTQNATLFYRGTCIQGRRHLAHMSNISLWISFAASIFSAHKKRTTPRCSIVVHVFRGAAIF
jgi:hypothetical protein